MRKLLLCVMAAIMFVACGKDDFSFNVKEEIKNPYAVTPEEAVQLLQTVIGDETTRSVSISDVQTLTKGNFTQTTRSGADDEVIYIVDIEGGGSAIMGADKRMEPIYAVLDNTKITAEQLVGATTRSESEGEDIEDYVLGLLNNAILCDIQEVETAG
ncbi:MAG: Spi family protease inhibitor, partial [Alistipes sp.]|nr:Spi family protease inhibitor [Alistipes sp.]